MDESSEPAWLQRMRAAAMQRPRTQFTKVRWADVQQLLRERDFLLDQASDSAQDTLRKMQAHDYGRGPT